MAIIIDVETIDPTGGPNLPSGVFITFDTKLYAGTTNVHFMLYYYRSKAAFLASKQRISAPTDCNLLSFEKRNIDPSVYIALNATSLHDIVRDEIETYIGTGNASIDLT